MQSPISAMKTGFRKAKEAISGAIAISKSHAASNTKKDLTKSEKWQLYLAMYYRRMAKRYRMPSTRNKTNENNRRKHQIRRGIIFFGTYPELYKA